ncbi:hypothetical protein C5167_041777 [Papaver somniferum]|nr:hypothetical protein C5167_041777 [Papaver somniferum]
MGTMKLVKIWSTWQRKHAQKPEGASHAQAQQRAIPIVTGSIKEEKDHVTVSKVPHSGCACAISIVNKDPTKDAQEVVHHAQAQQHAIPIVTGFINAEKDPAALLRAPHKGCACASLIVSDIGEMTIKQGR